MKSINSTASKFLEIKEQIKALEKQANKLKEMLMENGDCTTNKYVITIETKQRIGVVGHQELTNILGEDVVMSKGLLKVSQFEQLNVIDKKAS